MFDTDVEKTTNENNTYKVLRVVIIEKIMRGHCTLLLQLEIRPTLLCVIISSSSVLLYLSGALHAVVYTAQLVIMQ